MEIDTNGQKKKKQRRQFAVTFTELGLLGRPMVRMNGIPAYVESTKELQPQVGERWIVYVRYQDSERIILMPVEKILLPSS